MRIAILACLALAGCGASPPNYTRLMEESKAVRLCSDGTIVGKHPNGNHYFFKDTGAFTAVVGEVATAPEEFCGGETR